MQEFVCTNGCLTEFDTGFKCTNGWFECSRRFMKLVNGEMTSDKDWRVRLGTSVQRICQSFNSVVVVNSWILVGQFLRPSKEESMEPIAMLSVENPVQDGHVTIDCKGLDAVRISDKHIRPQLQFNFHPSRIELKYYC